MKILVKGNVTEHGNSKDVSLVEILEMYTVITAEKTDTNHINIDVNPNFTSDLMEALHMYTQVTGCDLTKFIRGKRYED